MVSDSASVALNLIQLIALTLPVLAILVQAMLRVQDVDSITNWKESTSGVHQWLINKRFAFVFYSFVALYIGLALCLYYLFAQMDLPALLNTAIITILVAFGLLLSGIAGLTWLVDTQISE